MTRRRWKNRQSDEGVRDCSTASDFRGGQPHRWSEFRLERRWRAAGHPLWTVDVYWGACLSDVAADGVPCLNGGNKMLVLSRKAGEAIVVNNGDITITVLGLTGKKVRLGVSASASIPVHRSETHHRIIPATKSQAEPEEDPAGIV